jgi:hypothetical protein
MSEIEAGDAFVDEVTATTDPFRLAIRGHQGISDVLVVALEEVLDAEVVRELGRLRFPLRVELAVALDAIPRGFRDALLVLNRIRNRFAHERGATFGATEAGELLAALPPEVADHLRSEIDKPSEKPVLVLATTIIIIFRSIQRAITAHRDGSVSVELALRLVYERDSGRDPSAVAPTGVRLLEYEQQLLEQSRAERAAEGKL